MTTSERERDFLDRIEDLETEVREYEKTVLFRNLFIILFCIFFFAAVFTSIIHYDGGTIVISLVACCIFFAAWASGFAIGIDEAKDPRPMLKTVRKNYYDFIARNNAS